MVHSSSVVKRSFMFLGALPRWSHSREWGDFPGGLVGLVLLVVVILAVTGRL